LSPADLFWDRCEGPIRFGVNDCCMVVADVVMAAGGRDLMSVYRGRYRTARGFVRAFRSQGHATLHAACDGVLLACGREVYDPQEFDVAVIEHFDLTICKTVSSPSVFMGGVWCFRTDMGGAAVLPSAFKDKLPTIYRIL